MAPLSFAVLVQVSFLTMGAETYADAYHTTVETGRPMVVLVGADWCAACRVMEHTVLPQIRERGGLGKVAFAIVNLDQERDLGDQLTNRGPIPQLLLFRKAEDGWKLRRLVGRQTVETVTSFIEQGVNANLTSKSTEAGSTETSTPPEALLTAQDPPAKNGAH